MNPAPMPAIAALYAGLIGLMLVVLAIPVSSLRYSLKIGLGDGGNARLTRAIRVHANAVEWALPTLLLLLLAELNRAPALALHVCGIALVAGRILHAVGLSSAGGPSFGRSVGPVSHGSRSSLWRCGTSGRSCASRWSEFPSVLSQKFRR